MHTCREVAVKSIGLLKEDENKNALANSGLALSLNEGTADISISLAEYVPYRMRGTHGIRYLQASYCSQCVDDRNQSLHYDS